MREQAQPGSETFGEIGFPGLEILKIMMNPKVLKYCGAVALLLIITLTISGCSTPQVLGNEEVFSSVDALWTAVTSRKEDRLQSASEKLQELRQSGELSEAGWNALEPIIQQASAGEWEPAAKRLKRFIRAQRKA